MSDSTKTFDFPLPNNKRLSFTFYQGKDLETLKGWANWQEQDIPSEYPGIRVFEVSDGHVLEIFKDNLIEYGYLFKSPEDYILYKKIVIPFSNKERSFISPFLNLQPGEVSRYLTAFEAKLLVKDHAEIEICEFAPGFILETNSRRSFGYIYASLEEYKVISSEFGLEQPALAFPIFQKGNKEEVEDQSN